MFIKSYTSLRRLCAPMLMLLLFCVSLSKGAGAQASAPPVTGSFVTTLTAPSGLGTVLQTALDNYGNWLVMDYSKGGLYEYPAGGGAVITLAPAGTFGAYDDPGITFDSANNLILEGNFSNCLLLFPYDTTTTPATWDNLSALNSTNTASSQCGTAPDSFAQYNLLTDVGTETNNYIQPWGLAMLPGNVLVSGSQQGSPRAPNQAAPFIFTLPILPGPSPAAGCVPGSGDDGECSPYDTPGSDNPSAATLVLLSMASRPNSVAADKFGNIYFVEDTGGLSGAYMIPAGNTQVPSDLSSVITRVDPNLANVTAVATDASGNLYISDSVAGVFMVPNPAGTPNPSAAVALTTVPAVGQVSVDSTRGILYIPTTNNGLSEVTFNTAALGSTAVGKPASASQTVTFTFNQAETPASFVIQEAGAANQDFAIATGGTCVAGTAYAANTSCTENVTLSPHAAGNVSARLALLDASGNVLGSINLQGTGKGSAVQIAQVTPGGESIIGAGLKTPTQVAVDAGGNTYVADPGLPGVVMYPKGYGAAAATTTVGTGLTAPTGVAVDGTGDVFIADSGNVIEVPEGTSGLNTAGQVTLRTGLGSGLNLAADGLGNLYIADPTNSRVVKLSSLNGSFGILGQTETDLTTGFSAPSAVAVDSSDNLYVIDGANLIEVPPDGTPSTLLSSLSGATGLAVDPSGAVYVAMPGGTMRIPNVSGALQASAATVIAANVTKPTSVAIDLADNVYITDGAAGDVAFVSASASTDFGTLTSTSGSQSSDYTITDVGNAALNVSGFSSTPDYSETASTCVGTPVAVGATCSATVTFNPGPGDQGTLTGQVLLQSDAANSPVGVDATGVGAALAGSSTTLTVTSATVDGASAAVTVAPSSGTGAVPTGQVTLTVTGANLTAPLSMTGMLTNGSVTITPQLAAGTYTYTVSYQGDRTYGTSTASAQVVVAAGAVTLTQPPLTASMTLYQSGGQNYILATNETASAAAEPFDGSATQFTFAYTVTIATTNGAPLIGQQIINPTTGKVSAVNYGSVSLQGAPYNAAAGTGCAPVAVQSDGTANVSPDCLPINNSNTSIVNLESTYTITPVYSPVGVGASCSSATSCPTNPNYTSVTGTPITVTVLRSPLVQISSDPSSISVQPGSSTSAKLTLSSVLGYGVAGAGSLTGDAGNNASLPVQLSCDGLPAYATCTFSYPTPDPSDPQSVDVGPNPQTVLSYMGGTAAACPPAQPGAIGGCFGPGTVIMTITTNIPTGIASLHRSSGKVEFAAILGFSLLGFSLGKRRKFRGRLLTLACLLLCGGVIAGMSGCSTQQLGTATSTATPAGTYAVSITAKQVGSQVIKAQPGITYGSGYQVSLPFTMNVTIQ